MRDTRPSLHSDLLTRLFLFSRIDPADQAQPLILIFSVRSFRRGSAEGLLFLVGLFRGLSTNTSQSDRFVMFF